MSTVETDRGHSVYLFAPSGQQGETSSTPDLVNRPTLKVGPIPVADRLNIALEEMHSGDLRYRIVDLKGRSVANGSKSVQGNSLELDLSQLPTGAYLLTLRAKDEMWVRRIQKR